MTINATALAVLKSAGAAAAGAAAGVIANHGLPLDRQGWLGMSGSVLSAVLMLWAHSPVTAIRAESDIKQETSHAG